MARGLHQPMQLRNRFRSIFPSPRFVATRLKVSADGTVVYETELATGQNLHFSANDKFEVTASDASRLLLELHGQKVMPAHTPGSSSTISLTSKDLRQAAGGPTQP